MQDFAVATLNGISYGLLLFMLAAFFVGVAGTLTLIDVELASAESVAMARSGAVLIATVIGGSSVFFGPVIAAGTYCIERCTGRCHARVARLSGSDVHRRRIELA